MRDRASRAAGRITPRYQVCSPGAFHFLLASHGASAYVGQFENEHPHPVTVNVIGICTGEVLTRHFPFSVHDVELLAKEGGQTNGRHHSVASPPSRGEI